MNQLGEISGVDTQPERIGLLTTGVAGLDRTLRFRWANPAFCETVGLSERRLSGQPLAILHGAGEQFINGNYFRTLKAPTLWRDEVQTIHDAGHLPQWEQTERFNALLAAFVTDCANRGR